MRRNAVFRMRSSPDPARRLRQVVSHGADAFASFEWDFEMLTRNPPLDHLSALLPCEWLNTRSTARLTAVARTAMMLWLWLL